MWVSRCIAVLPCALCPWDNMLDELINIDKIPVKCINLHHEFTCFWADGYTPKWGCSRYIDVAMVDWAAAAISSCKHNLIDI